MNCMILVADETAQNGGESHGNVEDKKKKDSNFSHFPNNQNGKVHNSQSENYKGKYKDGKDKSKAGKQNAAAPKQEHKFNLEADFPSLVGTPPFV